MSISAEIRGREALERKLTRELYIPPAERMIADAGTYARDQARAGAPRETGALASSLLASAKGLEARVGSTLAYALPVEFGRHAGAAQPPSDAFRGGFAAARAVARRGIKGRFFMRRALQLLTGGELPRLLTRAADEIERAWGR